MRLVDQQFQSAPSGTHIPSDGSSIGGVDPTTPYAPLILPDGSLYSMIESVPVAGKYPTVMTYYDRPVPSSATMAALGLNTLLFDFDLIWDANWATQGNATETDTMLVTPGATSTTNLRRNFSIQNVAGQFYLVQNNAWVPIPGAKPGILTAGVPHHHTIACSFTSTGGGVVSITVNGATYLVPSSLQKADVVEVNWTPGAVMQLQQSLIPTGKSFGLMLMGAGYSWLS